MACYYCDRSPCVCTPSMFDDVPRPLPSEMAIRADERAKVEREVVAYLMSLSKLADAHSCSGDCYHCGEAHALRYASERMPHRPKPGQPKEGGQ